MSLMLLLSKALVVWCAEDTELATAAMDLGFLLFVGPFAIVSVLNPFAAGMHQIICEVVITHLVIGEVLSNAVVLPLIDRQTSYNLSWDMWVHHFAGAASGLACLVLGRGTPELLTLGARLATTELTTALPVGFRQAMRNRKLNGGRSAAFAVMLPAAFTWRTVYSFQIFQKSVPLILNPDIALPILKFPATGCVFAIVCCNAYWTSKIFRGALKLATKKLSQRERDSYAKTLRADVQVKKAR